MPGHQSPVRFAVPIMVAWGLGYMTPASTAQEIGRGQDIVIGQTIPYSGAASMWGINGKADAAFVQMLNDRGGINGRKLRLISYDDGYSPPKTVEQTRKLVEGDDVLFIYKSLGTATNAAVSTYLNRKSVPQLLIATGSARWNDPAHSPWTMSAMLDYRTEGRLYANYLNAERPTAKVAVLYQNDDMGRDFLGGLTSGLGSKAAETIVKAIPYEVTDPTIDQQLIQLRWTGADTLFLSSGGKQTVQALRKTGELGWQPLTFVASFSSSVGQTLNLVGPQNAKGVMTAQVYKDPTDPQWKDDEEFRLYHSWLDKYLPAADHSDFVNVAAYSIGSLLQVILAKCGDDLSRKNIMAQATSLADVRMPLTLPGIAVNTSSSDFRPIKQARLVRFDGERYVAVTPVLTDTAK